MKTIQVTAWHDGKKNYGIRIGKHRDTLFNPKWTFVEVEIDSKSYQFKLTDSFWRKCPEIRDCGKPVIREWLARYKSLKWEFGKPPKMQLIQLGDCRFRLVP